MKIHLQIELNRPHLHLQRRFVWFEAAVLVLILTLTGAVSRVKADMGACSGAMITLPFNDILNSPSSGFFCFIAQIYFQGITSGTSATTYSPDNTVTRGQMAAFLARTEDLALKRGSRRAALNQWWTPQAANLGLTTVGNFPIRVASDGEDLWVANSSSGTVSRVHASDGVGRQTWDSAFDPSGVLIAMGKVFITGRKDPGRLYQIDPQGPCCSATTITSNLGNSPNGIAFDGARIWTANLGGSVSIVTLNPVSVTNVSGFSRLEGILYDGANIWVTDQGDFFRQPPTLAKLDNSGNIILTAPVDAGPVSPIFDGTNIWVPNSLDNTVTVVRASTGAVLATLSGNGLNGPNQAAFDGQRILVTNQFGNSVSLWKAADLTPLGSFATGAGSAPSGVCSDGINFWITLYTGPGHLVRF